MKSSEFNFCVHSLQEMEDDLVLEEEYLGVNIITFCPIEYWNKYQCMPDYYFSVIDELEKAAHLPEGYQNYIFVEETQWASKKSKEEIVKELITLGFVENKTMQKFLSDCWN